MLVGDAAGRHAQAVENIIHLFNDAGYDVSVNLVNAKDYWWLQ